MTVVGRAAVPAPIEVLDLVTAVKRAARMWGDRCAWVFDQSGERVSFREIDERSNHIAAALTAIGVQQGARVGIMLRNCAEFPLTWIGIQKTGAIMVPVNVHYRSTDARYIIDHAKISVIVAGNEFIELLVDVRDQLKTDIKLICVDGDGGGEARDLSGLPVDTVPVVSVHEHTLLNIQYTSGTTGEPKGCMLSNGWLMRFAWRVVIAHDGLDENDTLLTSQPFYYVDPQWNVAVGLLCGATLVVLDRFHPSNFWDKLRGYKVTWFYCLGVMPKLLLNTPKTELDRNHAVKRVLCSAIPSVDHAKIVARWGVPWYDAFGMTESGLDLAVSTADHDPTIGSGCIGTPVPGREARAVDGNDRPVAIGEIGELVLRGTGLMDGYYRNAEATANAFHNGWLHTGDLVRQDEVGRFYYVGRIKDMIRRGGENISAAEVEAVIMQHESVQLAACIAVDDELRGEEVKAYVVFNTSQQPVEPAVLAEFCLQRLAYFKVPRYWEFREGLPRTPSERVRKELLRTEPGDPTIGAFDRIDGVWR